MRITESILITAPLAINPHIEATISISEYRVMQKVAEKNPAPLTIIDGIEDANAF